MKIKMLACLFLSGLMMLACNNAPSSTDKSLDPAPLSKVEKGEMIFRQNCQTCHQLKIDAMGPAVKDALTRWNNDSTKLRSFIRNSGKMIADGDPRANELYAKWKVNMTSFPNFTDEELDQLIAYMQQ